MKTEEIVWRESTDTNGVELNLIGTSAELFKDAEMFPVTKNIGKRVTMMFRKDGKIANVIASQACTELFRAGGITIPQILGLQVAKTQATSGEDILVAILPASGWLQVKTIKVVDYKPVGVTLEDLIG